MCGRVRICKSRKNIYSCKFCNNNYSFDEVRMPYYYQNYLYKKWKVNLLV